MPPVNLNSSFATNSADPSSLQTRRGLCDSEDPFLELSDARKELAHV